MATAALTINDMGITPAKIATAVAGHTDGHNIPAEGRIVVAIYNTDAADHAVEVASTADANGRSGDLSVTVAAGGFALLGPFRPNLFVKLADPDKGKILIDYPVAATGMKMAAFRLPANAPGV